MCNLIIQNFCYDLDLIFGHFLQSSHSQNPENWYDHLESDFSQRADVMQQVLKKWKSLYFNCIQIK